MSEENGSKDRLLRRQVAGYGSAGWSLTFALLHVTWATGWYVGLDTDQARAAFERPWFYKYNLVAAGACAVAIPIALGLTGSYKNRLIVRLLMILAGSVTVILALRGIAGVIKAGYLRSTGQTMLNPLFLWDLWFCLGAILFGIAVWHFRQTLPERELKDGKIYE